MQDENASVLGGVAGHAGFFSTAEDLAIFAHAMLNGGHPILRSSTIDLFARRESAPDGTSRALGWDTPSTPSQSGKYFSSVPLDISATRARHCGSIPQRQLSMTLLTNRTWPDCQNQAIKQVRPAFHDAVIEALGNAEARSVKPQIRQAQRQEAARNFGQPQHRENQFCFRRSRSQIRA